MSKSPFDSQHTVSLYSRGHYTTIDCNDCIEKIFCQIYQYSGSQMRYTELCSSICPFNRTVGA